VKKRVTNNVLTSAADVQLRVSTRKTRSATSVIPSERASGSSTSYAEIASCRFWA